MSQRSRSYRILRGSAVCIALLAILFEAFILIQQRVLRYRAEHLLSDIRGLQLRKNTWTDAQKIMTRWGAWGHYEGDCTAQSCNYEIRLEDVLWQAADKHPKLDEHFVWFLRPYEMVGGRFSQTKAYLSITDGVVWEKGFAVFIHVPPESKEDGDYGYMLFGTSATVSHFRLFPHNNKNPDYWIRQPAGCEGCLAVHTEFTPYADSSDVERLMDFDLSCLTRWRACREQGDIMPAAWKEYTIGEGADVHSGSPIPGCDLSLKELGRDSHNAAIVDVISCHIENRSGETFRVSDVRLVRSLKGARFSQPDVTVEIKLADDTARLVPGHRFILFFFESVTVPPKLEIGPEQCGAIPFTEQNLSEVQLGIDQAYEFAQKEHQLKSHSFSIFH